VSGGSRYILSSGSLNYLINLSLRRKIMLFGRVMGITLSVLGIILSVIGYSMLSGPGFTIRLFIAGPAMLLSGLAMLVLPGGTLTLEETKQAGFDPKSFFRNAPIVHKIVWGVAGLVGVFFALSFTDSSFF